MKWDVIVIGAGPVGCFAAMQIAAAGFKVLILEEDQEIGLPVQCAGLVSARAVELTGATKSSIINKLKGFRVFSPLGAVLNVENDRDIALAIDRIIFDQELAAKAENAGAILLKGLRVKEIARISSGFRVTAAGKNTVSLETRLLIGADGSDSNVAKWLNLKCDNQKAVMYAADAELECSDPDFVNIFLGQELAPGWFGWKIPLDDKTCRLGIGYAMVQPKFSPKYYFQELLNRYPSIFKDHKIIRYTGGTVPLGLMPKIYSANAMLVGDAACQTKPISGGGIYMGLRGAQICAQTAVEALSEDNLSEAKMSSYQKLYEKDMKDEISHAMTLRESFLNLRDEDIESILKLLSKPQYQKLIIKYGDIDYPSRFAQKLSSLGPWKNIFLKFALKIAENTVQE